MESLFDGIYKDTKVLVTGHTGFKGSWLVNWLNRMGADVTGYSLEPPTNPNHYSLLDININSVIGDIRDSQKLEDVFSSFRPNIVFHLAAQPLVLKSYEEPVETYDVNVMGTLKVLEASKKVDVQAIVVITSDKVYENKEWVWGYRENDPVGGYDPYSSSKGCTELVISSYRNSFFNINDYKIKHNSLLASCRAGNVIGGGDWAANRLMNDIMVSASKKEKVVIRNPVATRPWQHVLEPLSGYLVVGKKLLENDPKFADSWNFGPGDEGNINVENVVKNSKRYWNAIDYEVDANQNRHHEARLLKLDCSKSHTYLKWKEVWNSDKTFEKTVEWYREFYENKTILTDEHLESYVSDAKKKNIEWAIDGSDKN